MPCSALISILIGSMFVSIAGATARAAPPSEALVQEFERRAERCDDTASRLTLARWAAGRELLDEADELLRAVLDDDPLNRDAYGALVALAEDRSLPRESDAYRSARSSLPHRFIEYDTRRFVVLSDADPHWTRAQAQQLERAHYQFHRFADRLDLHPRPLEHKLICVLFRDRGDYRQFGKRFDEVTDPWVAGYFSPQHDRTVFYYGGANPSVIDAWEKIDRMQDDVNDLERQVARIRRRGEPDQASVLEDRRRRYQEHVDRERERIETFTRQVNDATTIHETVHQLLFHTSVQSKRIEYPIWISEGLATAFETDSPHTAFGPVYDYAPRREGFDEVLREDRLIDLRELVTWTTIADDDERTVHAAYHESYALVMWMSRFRRDELRSYLESMLLEPPGTLSPQRHLELFERAFGDVDRLQRAWLRHERERLDD
jgi:hypothetical protein